VESPDAVAGRTLLLLRHAKSSWDDASLDDFERPLSRRGRDAAPLVGRHIARRGWVPDMAIVSPAARTRQTWDLVAAEFPRRPQLVVDRSIYEAEPGAILAAIRGISDDVATLMVVGHNPGLEQLAWRIAGDGSSAEALKTIRNKYPTGATAVFQLAGTWAHLDETACRLVDFISPRDLG
jgi:phosphohistidine phosphatase